MSDAPQACGSAVKVVSHAAAAAAAVPLPANPPRVCLHCQAVLPDEPWCPSCGRQMDDSTIGEDWQYVRVPPPSLDTQETSVGSPKSSIVSAVLQAPEPARTPGEAPPLTGDQTFRHGGWEDIRSLVRASLYRCGETAARVEAFDLCGACAWVEQHDEDATRFRLKSSYCHDRLCTPCANERSARLRDALQAAMGTAGHTFITLTLCGKNERLTDLVDRLYKSFRYLRAGKLWSEAVTGGAAFLEIKWSDKAARWHPHLHIICQAGYMPQAELSAAWRAITKDSFIVDIRRVKNPREAASYVAKYASKPLNMTFARVPARLDEATLALKGRRLCLTFGTWYGTPLDSAEDEPLAEDLDFVHWTNIGGLYELHRRAETGDALALAALTALNVYERMERFRPARDRNAGPSG